MGDLHLNSGELMEAEKGRRWSWLEAVDLLELEAECMPSQDLFVRCLVGLRSLTDWLLRRPARSKGLLLVLNKPGELQTESNPERPFRRHFWRLGLKE